MGWSVVEDAGRGWRRVVPSPLPQEIVELDTVKAVLGAGIIVITVGGGGIPVIDKGNGDYIGTAAVIDKDFASSLLARAIQADLFDHLLAILPEFGLRVFQESSDAMLMAMREGAGRG